MQGCVVLCGTSFPANLVSNGAEEGEQGGFEGWGCDSERMSEIETDSTSCRRRLLFELAFAAQALLGTASRTGTAAGSSSMVRSSPMCSCDWS